MVRALMNKRMKLAKNQKGMTLIELMAVVVILGILAAVAGAAVVKGFGDSKTNADNTSIQVIIDAAQRYTLDNPTLNVSSTDGTTATTALTTLRNGGYLSTIPSAKSKTNGFFKITYDTTNKYYTVTVEEGS